MTTLDATDDLEAVVASLRSLIADDNGPQVLSITEVLDYMLAPAGFACNAWQPIPLTPAHDKEKS